jgi:bifunctional non-homologous end joining protein LigD
MALTKYKQKRSFTKTPEPTGGRATGQELIFVIQKHAASRLHYDFRLEMRGVLKSWAVPKGPSTDPEIKRLAMMVEDHPYDYKDFYGSIPEGNYGAGEVEIWDEGFYFPVDEDHQPITEAQAEKNLDKGELKVLMAGTHLKGEFVLVRLKQDDKNWLLIKHRDDYSTEEEYDIASIDSVKSKKKRASPAKNAAKKTAPKKSAKTSPK